MGLLFYPRGGSAYVVRYLSPALERAGWARVARGRVARRTRRGDERRRRSSTAWTCTPLDSTDAVRAFEQGGDAIAAPAADAPVLRGPRRRARRDLRRGATRARRPPRRGVGGAVPRRRCRPGRPVPPAPPHAAARRRRAALARRPARRAPARHRAEAHRRDRAARRARRARSARRSRRCPTRRPGSSTSDAAQRPRRRGARDVAHDAMGVAGATASSGPIT